ncbi:MAG: creatininase family protein [Gemmatimonadota bacterium]|nr:creatininase family protein [Gemmatimonadota bacterium]
MSDSPTPAQRPLLLKRLRPNEVCEHLKRDSRLIVAVGTTEQHGPHLPLGCDTIIVERLADELSVEFQVLRAPTIEYGVNAPTVTPFPGSASVRPKTLHRLLNDLVGDWEEGGVTEFIILTAHGSDPHQEALSTLRTKSARVRTVDIFSVPRLVAETDPNVPVHGGEIDTSLLLHIDRELVQLDLAQDFETSKAMARRYHRGARGGIPRTSTGSLGRPTLSSVEKGETLYRVIFQRIASRIFRDH